MTDYNDCKKYLRSYRIYDLLVLFKKCKTLDCTTQVSFLKKSCDLKYHIYNEHLCVIQFCQSQIFTILINIFKLKI